MSEPGLLAFDVLQLNVGFRQFLFQFSDPFFRDRGARQLQIFEAR